MFTFLSLRVLHSSMEYNAFFYSQDYFFFNFYISILHLPLFASMNAIYLWVKSQVFQTFPLAKHTSTLTQIKIISISSFALILVSLYIQVCHPNFHRSVHSKSNTQVGRRHDFPLCWHKFVGPAPSAAKDGLKPHHFLFRDRHMFSLLLYVTKRYSKHSCKQLLSSNQDHI